MDVPEPEQTPFMAVTAHTSRLARVSRIKLSRKAKRIREAGFGV